MKVSQLAGEEIVARIPPVPLGHVDESLFAHEYSRSFQATRLHEIGMCRILPNGFLMDAWSLLPRLETFSVPPRRFQHIKNALKVVIGNLRRTRKIHIHEPVLFVTDEHSNGYFHWIADVLARLELFVMVHGSQALHDFTLVVPAMANFPYSLESLAPYNLGKVVVLGVNERAYCRNVSLISPVAPTGNFRPQVMQAMRQRFSIYFKTGKAFRKIFISRTNAPRRKIDNEVDLLTMLKKHGFELVVLEQLTFGDQVKMLAEASVMIGLHGAGLVNMNWMTKGSKVLELRFRADNHNNCYYAQASALGLHYHYLLVDKTDPASDVHNADASVDPQALDQLLRAL